MASNASALLCAGLALLLWSGVGWVFARRLPMDRALVLPLAPALGWAVQSAIALAAALAGGFSWLTILGAPALACAAALIMGRSQAEPEAGGASFPRWIVFAAALLALIPAAAVLPKFSGDSVFLAAPIFDHSKVALIDEILRNGVPPANPVFAEGGGAGRVAYYYLWHFSAAQLASVMSASGWEADIATTWFTAFASLLLMCGFAFDLTKRNLSPAVVLVLAFCGSVRPVLGWLLGRDGVDAVIQPASGLAGWLFQVSWSPHHVAAAGCAVLAAWLMAQLARRPSIFATITLALVLTAGFESSIWVGGIVFALAGSAIGLTLLVGQEPRRRIRFLADCLAAGLGALLLASPLIVEQIHAAAARASGFPIIIDAFHVLGPAFPDSVRRWLDLPAYWLMLLGVEIPAIFFAGVVALVAMARSKGLDRDRKTAVVVFALLAAVSLCCTWLLVSTAGENNDLGWRAVLPGVMVLTVGAAAGIAKWITQSAAVGAALVAAALALPDGANLGLGNVTGDATPAGAIFAHDPAMWAALRQYTPPDARVANNPQYLKTLAPWPINVSWALLADRRSCWAGYGLAVAFVSLPQRKLEEISTLFIRVFDGRGTVQDVSALAEVYGCHSILVTKEDGAWLRDPFAVNPLYRLAEANPGNWRIYVIAQDMDSAQP